VGVSSDTLGGVNINRMTWEQSCQGHDMDTCVMNRLDPIEELYDMYSEKEDTPRIVELGDDGLDWVSDIKGPANPYMDL